MLRGLLGNRSRCRRTSRSARSGSWRQRKQNHDRCAHRRRGRIAPAAARRTISLFSARAMARPSAPVIAKARSATSCRTSSRTKSSWGSNSTADGTGIETIVARGQGFSPAHLIVEGREGQQGLQSVAWRRFRKTFIGRMGGGVTIFSRPSRHTSTGERSGHFNVRFGRGRRHLETVHL